MTENQDSTCALLVKYAIVAENPGYRVGDDGSVWSRMMTGRYAKGNYTAVWRRLKPAKGSQYGHLRVELGRKVYRFVHRLVLEAFRGPCPEGEECLHDDGDPTNNRLDNLAWGTRKENHADSVRHGTAFFSPDNPLLGEDNPTAKLTEDVVRAIMVERSRNGAGAKTIARALGLPEEMRGAIDGIVRGQSWNHISGLPPYKPQSNRPGRRPASAEGDRVASPAPPAMAEDKTRYLPPSEGGQGSDVSPIAPTSYVAQDLFPV